MKKILFFIPTLMHGGAERVLVNLVNNLDVDKYEITVQTIFDVGVNKQYLKQHIKYKSIFPKLFRGSSLIFQLFSPEFLYKVLIKEKYDIIVSYLEGPTARILSGCPWGDCKKVSWIHIELNSAELFKRGFRNYQEAKKCYESFEKNICVSNTVKDMFEQVSGIEENVEVLYNTNESDVIIEKSKEPIEEGVLEKDMLNICSVAKIVNTKGYDRLVRAHKQLLEKGLKHHIYLLGIGEQEEEILEFVKKNDLENSFTLLGFQENPYKYMAKCDLYVCSSRREGFSTAVTEALILGVPVVSTLCSGAEELLGKNKEYGIVVENSTQGILEGMEKILTNPELLDYYREKAQIRGKDFEKSKTVREIEKLFDSL